MTNWTTPQLQGSDVSAFLMRYDCGTEVGSGAG